MADNAVIQIRGRERERASLLLLLPCPLPASPRPHSLTHSLCAWYGMTAIFFFVSRQESELDRVADSNRGCARFREGLLGPD